MAICYRCGAETHLYSNETPICLACVDALPPQTRPTWDAVQLPNNTQLGLPHD
jgi:hypothetical protein